ncbi:MAG: spore coat protein [Oscillospiraceae bacterium]|nr:spore coat protein [Oscillospiraceae bacterium]
MANLTAKELSAIQDHLSVEENMIKKYRMYAQTTQDGQIRQRCDEIANKHQAHFNTLMGHLN